MTSSEPTELVSCGGCQKVNTVPFGLDKFKCYNCGVMVAISREPSAACAAASATALKFQEQQEQSQAAAYPPSQAGAGGGAAGSQAARTAPPAELKQRSEGSSSFFGKLQKSMDKTFQKVEKNIMSLAGTGGVAGSTAAGPTSGKTEVPEISQRAPILNSEEEQLQWALRASIAEAEGQKDPATAAPASKETIMGRRPQGSPAEDGEVAGSDALQAAESRAARAERELAAAQAREAAVLAEREKLRRQLEENEGLIRGLTEQLDAVNTRLEAQTNQCRELERSLATAQDVATLAREAAATRRPEDQNEDEERREEELERQGTVAQLLQRISELEATLLRATHFAPVEPSSDSALPKQIGTSVDDSTQIRATGDSDEERRAISSTAKPTETTAAALGEAAATSDPKLGDAPVAADAVAALVGGEDPETSLLAQGDTPAASEAEVSAVSAGEAGAYPAAALVTEEDPQPAASETDVMVVGSATGDADASTVAEISSKTEAPSLAAEAEGPDIKDTASAEAKTER